ncbi:MAG: NUDIX domain-containing protein [Dehalococcoidia bacterium]|nr:NUDIX domain-containing protein [Dehalococcoidia bacterium]
MTTPDVPIPRPTARVLLLDPDDRLFLIHNAGEIINIGLPSVWLPPGGRLEAGETHEEAARRELQEEVGLTDVEIGPCVWLRTFPFELNDAHYAKHERYFICRVDHFEIGADLDVDPEGVISYRWWSLDGIDAATDQLFVPRALGRHLRPILAGDIPPAPIEVDI